MSSSGGGSSTKVVLLALESVCGVPLKHFTLVRREALLEDGAEIAAEKGNYYLCLGKHQVVLITRPSLRGKAAVVALSFRYSSVMNVIVDSFSVVSAASSSEIFAFQFFLKTPQFVASLSSTTSATAPASDAAPTYLPNLICFRCSDARQFLDEFTVCYKTDYMFLNWKPHLKEIEIHSALVPLLQGAKTGEESLEAFTTPPEGHVKESLNGYFFFIPSEYIRVSERRIGASSATFAIKPKDMYVYPYIEIAFEPVTPLDYEANQPYQSEQKNLVFSERRTDDSEDQADGAPTMITTFRRQARMRSLLSIAERVVNDLGKLLQDYCILGRPTSYFKSMNLTGDPASWECWEIRMRAFHLNQIFNSSDIARRTEMRDIIVIAARRKYIPPTMDNYQDVTLVYFGQQRRFENLSKNEMAAAPSSFSLAVPQSDHILERIIDSLSPESLNFDVDEYVIQAKADALQFDEDTYRWYASSSRIRILPKVYPEAKKFCEAIHKLLGTWGVENLPPLQLAATSLTMSSGTSGGSSSRQRRGTHRRREEIPRAEAQDEPAAVAESIDPFEFSKTIEETYTVNYGRLAHDPSFERYLKAWKLRVWRYLAYCVDGGIFPGVLTIENLVRHYFDLKSNNSAQSTLARILDYLLYLRPMDGEFEPNGSLIAKVRDPNTMKNFSFNSLVMERLLETNYIKMVLDSEGDAAMFPYFLKQLLAQQYEHKTSSSMSSRADAHNSSEPMLPSLQFSICKKLIEHGVTTEGSRVGPSEEGSMHPKELSFILDEQALETIVPCMTSILTTTNEDNGLRVLAMVALVNFSKGNQNVKNKIMGSGAGRTAVRLLLSKNDDLVRHACSLINNLINKTSHRESIKSDGAFEYLFQLLRPRHYEPRFRSIQVLIQACAVLSQFAGDAEHRKDLTDCLKSMKVPDPKRDGVPYVIPRTFRILLDLLVGSINVFPSLNASQISADAAAASAIFRNARREDAETLQVNIIIVLKNLCVESTSNKKVLSHFASSDLVKIVSEGESRTVVEAAFRCILVLCFEKNSCTELKNKGLQAALDARKADFEIAKQIQAKMISMAQ